MNFHKNKNNAKVGDLQVEQHNQLQRRLCSHSQCLAAKKNVEALLFLQKQAPSTFIEKKKKITHGKRRSCS